MQVPFLDLRRQYASIREELEQCMRDVFDAGIFVGGPYVHQFEEAFRKLCQAAYCVGVGNCTDALFLSLKALGIGPGDEVITPAFSWISTSEVISLAGAIPVFADVEADHYTIDVTDIEKKVTGKTRAIIAVHLYGQPSDMDALHRVCEAHQLDLIEDCSHAFLARSGNKPTGNFGRMACFSFYPTKNLGAYGDAGCVITEDPDLAARIRKLANHGGLIKDEHQIEGTNSRLDTLQAALLAAKIPHLPGWTQRRVSIAAIYNERLGKLPQIQVPAVRQGTYHTFHLYVIRAEQRDELRKHLRAQGVETQIHYPHAIPFEPAYKHLTHTPKEFPVSARLQDSVLSLPVFPELTDEEVQYVCEQITVFYK